MQTLTSSEKLIPVLPGILDRPPLLFNCASGTLDLETGKLRPHRREDHITKLCSLDYNPDATCPNFERFLAVIFDNDLELVLFMQRLLGRCLSGDVSEQILPIFWGTGANGKSTLVNAMFSVLGPDYSLKANQDLLIDHRNEQHPTELAQLFGKRFVVCSETKMHKRLNESLVKDLTGGEPIRARRMREDFWEFMPTHKIILLTNHKPRILGADHGIWRRLRLVPFEVKFWDPTDPATKKQALPEELRADKDLGPKLEAEREGILAWLVSGCRDWLQNGLTVPSKVIEATASYRRAEDLLGMFMEASCVLGEGFRCQASDLFRAYVAWCETNKEKPGTQKSFGEAMTERGFEKFTSNGTFYRGIALRTGEVGQPGTMEPCFVVEG